jgi:hypothetical protein
MSPFPSLFHQKLLARVHISASPVAVTDEAVIESLDVHPQARQQSKPLPESSLAQLQPHWAIGQACCPNIILRNIALHAAV